MLARRLAFSLVLILPLAARVASPAAAAPLCVPGVEAVDRCEAWEAVYNNEAAQSAGSFDYTGDITASPDGKTVFVTGRSWDATTSRLKAATVAYDVATGNQLWVDRYEGDEPENDYLSSLAVSPDGSTVYATGVEGMNPVGELGEYLTVAYDAATGARRWVATYDSPQAGDQDEEAHRVAVSPDGNWVYVTGQTGSQHGNADVATIAYRAATGKEAWVSEYSRVPGAGEDIGVDLLATNDAVYVAGAMGTRIAAMKIGTGDPATDPDAGRVLWSTADRPGYGYWIALAPDGSRVFVSGSDQTPTNATLGPDWDYATLAFDAATGQELWMSTYTSPDKGLDVPYGHALSPSGDRIYVTGRAQGAAGVFDGDYATVAFDTASGTRLWATRFSTPGTLFETGADVAVSPDGSRVYVSGGSTAWSGYGDAITQAYNASTGAVVWSGRNNVTPDRAEAGWRMTIAGSRLVVAGSSSYSFDSADPLNQTPAGNSSDYLIFAYDLP
jgi:hypothetical protein